MYQILDRISRIDSHNCFLIGGHGELFDSIHGRQVQHETESDVHIEDVEISPEIDLDVAGRKLTGTDSDHHEKPEMKPKTLGIAFASQPRCLSLQKLLNADTSDSNHRHEAKLAPFQFYQSSRRPKPS